MNKLIAIDNGHGISTPGKRTPKMPNGRVIHEWEFNYPTAKKLGKLLQHNGFKILYVSNTEKDTPLKTRTNKANNSNVDMFVSIHYNAFKSQWGNHGGIETYHYPGSINGRKMAEYVQAELIKETNLRDRGVKSANYHVLRETKMTSILCECGFMDNLKEAKLMLDEKYQWKCARAIAKGICQYYGVNFKDIKKEVNKVSKNQTVSNWAKEAWAWGKENKITDGKRPKDNMTREEMVTMLYRYDKLNK